MVAPWRPVAMPCPPGSTPTMRTLQAEAGGPLALDALGPHVHPALAPQERARGGAGHAVLARARLGDHALLAHARGQQGLAQHVVPLVGAGMAEVLALEPDARAAT